MVRGLIIALSLFASGCAGPSLTVGGEKWRGRSNFAVDLGKVGEKEGGLGYKFNPFATIDFGEGFDATRFIRTYMKQTTTKNWDVSVAASDPTSQVASVEIKFEGGLQEQGEFTIINLDEMIISDALTDPRNAKVVERLKYSRDRARVVVGVALTKNFSQVKSVKVSGKGQAIVEGVNVGVGGSSSEKVVMSLSDGSVFAYRFMRPVWIKDDNGFRFVRLVRDDFGFDKNLFPGETFSPQ